MAKEKKLNSMRLLEQHKIAYEAVYFDESIHSAVELAETTGHPPHIVYKTLVVDTGDKKPLLALIPGSANLDLKKLAKVAGYKKLAMASHARAEKWTGLKTGGISPLALMAKNWTVYIDESVTQLEHMLLSAGQRGINLKVPVKDLLRVLEAKISDIVTAPSMGE